MLLSTFEFVIIGVGQVTAAVHSKNITLLFLMPPPPRNDHCENNVDED